MKQYFEEVRGLAYEIKDLAAGGRMYAANLMDEDHSEPFMLAMFCVIERNAAAVLELFNSLELIPAIGDIRPREGNRKPIQNNAGLTARPAGKPAGYFSYVTFLKKCIFSVIIPKYY